MYYYLFMTIFLVAFMLLTGYLVYKFNKTSIFQLIKNKKIARIILLIVFIIAIIFMILDAINTLIVLIHIFASFLFYEFVIGLINLITKKTINNSISFTLALITTIIYLSYGYYMAHHVVETRYIIKSNKDIGVDNFRIVQISDSHIGTVISGKRFSKYIDKINKLNPDIVVITGDFVDDDSKLNNMIKASNALGKLKTKYGVYFIYGNHDKAYFNYRNFDNKDLKKELKKNNVIILEDDYKLITDNIYLVGRQDSQEKDRMSAEEITENLDKNKYIIGLDHKPNDYGNEVNAGFDLVLLGHTHGGQMWPLGPISVYMGINDSYYGLKTIDNTDFIVNAGIGDWAIKFKTFAKAEYVVIDIKNNR